MENENQGVNILALAAALFNASEQIKVLDGRLTQLAEKHVKEMQAASDRMDLLESRLMALSADPEQLGLN
jgi:hypothetical protein